MKRPIDKRFRQAVLDGVKITTIRKTGWPVGVPITLYYWSGKPYHSKHEDVCKIAVKSALMISILHSSNGIFYSINVNASPANPLYKTEGFSSQIEMDDWFKCALKHGEVGHFWLMEFEVAQ